MAVRSIVCLISAMAASLVALPAAFGQDAVENPDAKNSPSSVVSAESSEASRPAFSSQGFKATIANVSADARGIIVAQLVLQNATPDGEYVTVVGSYFASTSSARKYHIQQVSGLSYCEPRIGFEEDDNVRIGACLKGEKTALAKEQYSFIDPGSSQVVNMEFYPASEGKVGDSLTFSLKFIARKEEEGSSGLSASPKADTTGLSAPKIVTIGFPLIPIKAADQH